MEIVINIKILKPVMDPKEKRTDSFLLGVNYWPTRQNIRMWKNWESDQIEQDMEALEKMGNRIVRAFILDEDFVNNYGEIVEESIKKLQEFLDICKRHHQRVMITFLVGHMSGRNWFIPWALENNIYSSESMVKFANFVRSVVKRFKEHISIEGWIMSNEMSIVKASKNKEEALAIEKIFYGTVKTLDKNHLVSSGDVISFLQEPPNIEGNSDYAGLHIYFYDNDQVRHRFTYGCMLNIYENDGGNKVLLEEFGFSTNQISEISQAEFIYSTLWEAYVNHSIGAIVWCSSDFGNISDPPYDWRLIELKFGLMDENRNLKRGGHMFKQFSEELQILEKKWFGSEIKEDEPETSVIVPFYSYENYTSVDKNYRSLLFQRFPNALTIALQLMKMALIETSAFYEDHIEDHIKGKKLLIIPSVPTLKARTWQFIYETVKNSNIGVYASTFRGINGTINLANFHESFTNVMAQLFGVSTALRAGERGIKYFRQIDITFINDMGNVKRGRKFHIDLDNTQIYTYRINPENAEIIAVDENNNPVITRSGNCRAYLSTIPIELILSLNDVVKWEEGYNEIYEGIARECSIRPLIRCTSNLIEIRHFAGNGNDILIALNHGQGTVAELSDLNGKYELISGNSTLISADDSSAKLDLPIEGVAVLCRS